MKQVDVAIAIIHQQERILICQRHKGDQFADLWEFPGGKIEPPESPSQCAVREAAEELGLQIEIESSFPVIRHDYPELSVTIWPFLARPISGEARPLASQRLTWVPISELRRYPFPSANDALLGQVIERVSALGRDA
jgi:8-oxo-dGTP diphosphatase